MRWNIGRKLATAFAVPAVLSATVAITSYRGLVTNVEDVRWVTHTYDVLQTLDGVIASLADAETGQRGFLLTGTDAYLEPYAQGTAAATSDVERLSTLVADNAAQQQHIAPLRALTAAKLAVLQETIDLRRTKGFDAALALVRTDRGKQAMDQIRALVGEMKSAELLLLQARRQATDSSTATVKLAILLGTLLSIISLVVAGLWLTRSIARPIGAVTTLAERVAAGDLPLRVEAEDRSDEVGMLQLALRAMVDNLRNSNKELRSGFSVLASSSTEILATVSQVATGAAETATAVSETSTTAEEVKQTAHLSNQKAKAVQETAQKAAAVAETGRKAVAETLEGMNRIREQMESIAESVVRLSEQGQTIGEIIATVNDLAEQSNLLAVNAAIEATRAGEYGKGFGVVAQEVKSLAEQSRQATTQVRTILMEVQKATSAAVMATEQGTKAVAAGVRQATDAGESIRALSSSVGEASQAAAQIAASSQQQLVGMDQIASAIANIQQATTQNMAGTKQLEASAQGLQELGGRLKVLVERQRVEG